MNKPVELPEHVWAFGEWFLAELERHQERGDNFEDAVRKTMIQLSGRVGSAGR